MLCLTVRPSGFPPGRSRWVRVDFQNCFGEQSISKFLTWKWEKTCVQMLLFKLGEIRSLILTMPNWRHLKCIQVVIPGSDSLSQFVAQRRLWLYFYNLTYPYVEEWKAWTLVLGQTRDRKNLAPPNLWSRQIFPLAGELSRNLQCTMVTD